MSNTIYDTWKGTVDRITRWVAKDFPDIEPEDISQDLFTLICERRWTNPDDESVRTVLQRVARWKARAYRAQHLAVTPQYSYRTSEIRTILEKVFDHEDWPMRSVPSFQHQDAFRENAQWGLWDNSEELSVNGQFNRLGEVVVTDGVATSVNAISAPNVDWEDRITAFSDVKWAWQRLSRDYRKAIFKRYALGWIPDRGSSEAKRLERAVAKVVEILNTYRRGGG